MHGKLGVPIKRFRDEKHISPPHAMSSNASVGGSSSTPIIYYILILGTLLMLALGCLLVAKKWRKKGSEKEGEKENLER